MSSADGLWNALYDNNPNFRRSLEEVNVLLAEAGVTAAGLRAEQIEAIATSRWATATDPVPDETVSALARYLEVSERLDRSGYRRTSYVESGAAGRPRQPAFAHAPGRVLASLVAFVMMVAFIGFFGYTRSDSVRLRCLGEKVVGIHQGFSEKFICALAGS